MRVFSYSHTEAGIRERARLAGRELPRATPLRPRVKPAPTPAPEPVEPTVESEMQKLARRGMPGWVREMVAESAISNGVDILALVGRSRNVRLVEIRNELFYRIRTTPSPINGLIASLPQIANWFGREHTGVLFCVTKHAMLHGLPLDSKHDVARQIQRRREKSSERWERIKAERQHREAAR